MSVACGRHHVVGLDEPERLLCGRRTDHAPTVPLAQAGQDSQLCQKCRQRLWYEIYLDEQAREPRPAGWQYKFAFVMEYAYG